MSGEPAVGEDGPTLRAAADLLVAYPFQAWFYGDSIGFEGLVAATDTWGEGRWASFAHGFLRGWAARRDPWQPDDNTAPGHVMCAFCERDKDAILWDATIALAEHLAERRRIRGVSVTFEDAGRSLREPYGGVRLADHEREILTDPGAGIYVDCLHFDPPFFAHLARITGERSWAERAIDEARGYGDLLLDADTGLYHHFWLERTAAAYALGWGRGQGWALLGLLDLLELTDPFLPGRDEIGRRAAALAEAMLERQREDGSWSTVVQIPASGTETSTGAFMAAAFFRGVRIGVLPADRFAEAAERAWQATLHHLPPSGRLLDVSAAVYSSTALEHYSHVPTGFLVPWGQGPVLVAAAERRRQRGGAGAARTRTRRSREPEA